MCPTPHFSPLVNHNASILDLINKKYVKCLEQAWKVAHEIIEKAQQSMEKQAKKHWHEPNFNVRDSVWITMKNWKTE